MATDDTPCPLCDPEQGLTSPVLLVEGRCPCCDREFPGVAECLECGGTGYVVGDHGDCSSCPRSGRSPVGVHPSAQCGGPGDESGLIVCPACLRGEAPG